RDLLESAIKTVRAEKHKDVRERAEHAAEERLLNALVGETATPDTRSKFRARLRSGELDDKEIDLEVADTGSGFPSFDIPGMPGSSMGVININEMLGKAMGGRMKTKHVNVKVGRDILIQEES